MSKFLDLMCDPTADPDEVWRAWEHRMEVRCNQEDADARYGVACCGEGILFLDFLGEGRCALCGQVILKTDIAQAHGFPTSEVGTDTIPMTDRVD